MTDQTTVTLFGKGFNYSQDGSGITPENFTPSHLIVGMIEGIVDELALFYRDMTESGTAKPAARLVGSGNGLRYNTVMRKVVSGRFGLPLAMSEVHEEAAYGAAKFALMLL